MGFLPGVELDVRMVPFLAPTISDVVGRDVVLVSSGDVAAFQALGRPLLGPELGTVEPVAW